MIDNSPRMLLYIEPQSPKLDSPVLDDMTQKMTSAFGQNKTGVAYEGQFMEGSATMGWQTCACGARSTNVDYLLESGFVTNSLCIHYLAWHRNEVPQSELDKVASLPNGLVTPTPEQLQ